MAKIKMGMIGSGSYGENAATYFSHFSEQCEVVAFLDVDPAIAQKAADRYAGTAYTDLDAFLAHPDLDAVAVNTPVMLHHSHCKSALEAGKHVFVAKPVTVFLDEAEELLEIARRENLSLMVAHHTRHKPQNLKIKELIDAGELGTHFNFMASCCSSAGLELQESDWRAQPDVNPGGPLLQCGIHTLDVLISFFGRVSRVAALIQDKVTPLPVDDNVSLLIEFASGVTGTFQTNYTTAYSHSLDILGQDAALHVREHITGMGQTQLYLQRRIRDLHEPWEMLRIPAAPVAGLPAGAGLLEQQFLAEIAGGTPCYENMRDSIDALKIVHAAVESSKNNRVVTF